MIISIIRYGWQNMDLSELTEHTLANGIFNSVIEKSCSIYEYEQDFSIYNNIFYNISFDYPENFSL